MINKVMETKENILKVIIYAIIAFFMSALICGVMLIVYNFLY